MKEWLKHPVTFKINNILEENKIKGNVLGIGSSPQDKEVLNLPYFSKDPGKFNLTGINISGKFGEHKNFKIIKCNAHNICFSDRYFDIIICNAMLEHDAEFWKTISEVNRVLRSDGLFIVSVPCYSYCKTEVKDATLTYKVHGDDYYRFSDKSVKEVFLNGMKDVQSETVMIPLELLHGEKDNICN